ncbi:hypothetical protein CMUS01_10445 [Colletotrichum musicola]|uniref:Uncharacterized protein n=1 Tax=Colletotrichum musicola TaxID=2175873 RepID=A0A8H6K3D8_9PEZI|nr:hypothetical protein CMUS01_10445 [Colletotrichum musicola]
MPAITTSPLRHSPTQQRHSSSSSSNGPAAPYTHSCGTSPPRCKSTGLAPFTVERGNAALDRRPPPPPPPPPRPFERGITQSHTRSTPAKTRAARCPWQMGRGSIIHLDEFHLSISQYAMRISPIMTALIISGRQHPFPLQPSACGLFPMWISEVDAWRSSQHFRLLI